jgi:hypothetical protein
MYAKKAPTSPAATAAIAASRLTGIFHEAHGPAAANEEKAEAKWALPPGLWNFDSATRRLELQHKIEGELAPKVEQLKKERDGSQAQLQHSDQKLQEAQQTVKTLDDSLATQQKEHRAAMWKLQTSVKRCQQEIAGLRAQKTEKLAAIQQEKKKIEQLKEELQQLKESKASRRADILATFKQTATDQMLQYKDAVLVRNRINEIKQATKDDPDAQATFDFNPTHYKNVKAVDAALYKSMGALAERAFSKKAERDVKETKAEIALEEKAAAVRAEKIVVLQHYMRGIMNYLKARMPNVAAAQKGSTLARLQEPLEKALLFGKDASEKKAAKEAFFKELGELENATLERGGWGWGGNTPVTKIRAFVDLLTQEEAKAETNQSVRNLTTAADAHLRSHGSSSGFAQHVLTSEKDPGLASARALRTKEETAKLASVTSSPRMQRRLAAADPANIARNVSEFTDALADRKKESLDKTLTALGRDSKDSQTLSRLAAIASAPASLASATDAQRDVLTKTGDALSQSRDDDASFFADLEKAHGGAMPGMTDSIHAARVELGALDHEIDEKEEALTEAKENNDIQSLTEGIAGLDRSIKEETTSLDRDSTAVDQLQQTQATETAQLEAKRDAAVSQRDTATQAHTAAEQAQQAAETKLQQATQTLADAKRDLARAANAETPAERQQKVCDLLRAQVTLAAARYLHCLQEGKDEKGQPITGRHGDAGRDRAIDLVEKISRMTDPAEITAAINATLGARRGFFAGGGYVLGDHSFNTYLLKELYNEGKGIFNLKFDQAGNPCYPAYPSTVTTPLSLTGTSDQKADALRKLYSSDVRSQGTPSSGHVTDLQKMPESTRGEICKRVMSELATLPERMRQATPQYSAAPSSPTRSIPDSPGRGRAA